MSSELLSWADLVFHVLAHVRATSHVASSVYDALYVGFAERHLGPARERSLHEDAEVIGRIAGNHEVLAAVQWLAWLHETFEEAEAVAEVEITELNPTQVADAGVLAHLTRLGPAAEVLRCAALLELPSWDNLPSPPPSDLAAQLQRLTPVSPWLALCKVRSVRSLRLRGRVREREVWVGSPMDELALTSRHCGWQAAHEATVAEVAAMIRQLGGTPLYAPLEHVAVVLLATRAQLCGMEQEHRTWLSHLGNPPSHLRGSLSQEELLVHDRCLE